MRYDWPAQSRLAALVAIIQEVGRSSATMRMWRAVN
jgi:hypothetical protein